MKRSLLFLPILVLTLVFVAPSHATVMNYTFSVNVTGVTDTLGLIGGAVSAGQTLTYVFQIDFAAPGTGLRFNNVTYTYPDTPGVAPVTGTLDYFYADFVSGYFVPVAASPAYNSTNAPTKLQEFNLGYNDTRSNSTTPSRIYGLSDNNPIRIQTSSQSLTVADWVLGTTGLYFSDYSYGSAYPTTPTAYSLISGRATLTDIQPVVDPPPVPEPATMFLLGTGLIGIGVYARKRFKK